MNGTKLIECPHCRSFATIREKPQYNSVDCWNCSMCFCLGCSNRPHFPLTCEQFAIWMEKFEHQRYLELSRTDPNSVFMCQCGNILHHSNKTWKVSCRACGTKYNWKLHSKFDDERIKCTNFADEYTPNYIAAEYSDICLPVYEMRFDANFFYDLKQHLKSSSVLNSGLLISNFKLALHLIELGFAWLYLTKAQKPDEWTTLKTLLSQLQSLVDSITTAVRNGLPVVNANQKAAELKKLVGIIMNELSNVHI
uniref:IBR domain-containing protein n=1 Tax=Panagrellus redivivus TaxID=6233 RepID=A0A7E4VXI9_PANRE